MKYLALIGRIFYSMLFIMTIKTHFSDKAIAYAASNGVPMPNILVPFSGVMAFVGGVCILLGYRAQVGAWLIILFLVPVTFTMHAFWKETEPMQIQMQMTNFIKNFSLMGGAFLIAYFGAGPLSIDNRKYLPAEKKEPMLGKKMKTA